MHLTKPQKLIYDMEMFAGGAIAVICGSMLVHGTKDLSEIKKAVNELYRLNAALRMRIVETDGETSQTICDYAEQDFNVLSFNDKAELETYAQNYAKTPLDFYGNLCEINIITLPEQYGLLIKLHHIIGDAWTLALLGTQFNKLMNGEEVESYSYTDYIANEDAYIQSKRYERDKTFFLEQFKKCDEVTYLNEKQSDSLNACRKTFVVDKEQTGAINTYAQQKGTSAFMLFTAALSTYMNRVKMNAEKFYIGTAVLNRSGVKENNTVGMFVNTVPMLMELDNTKSFAENLSAIEDTAFSVFRHQKYNYGDVLSTIRKEFEFTEKFYDVMISYQNATITGADIETTWYHSGAQSESLQIHIDDRDSEGVFRVHYDYLTDKFTEHEIERLHQHICNLLFDAISDDSKKLYELNILAVYEKQKLLYEFNNTAMDYPRDKCVHQLFEEQAKATPGKTAVIATNALLTYAELNEQANRIAHSLVEKGVGVGDVVAIKLPRRSYLLSAMLGVLKAGAAYMPIDLAYPKDRINYMMAESKARVCIDENNVVALLANENSANLDTIVAHSDAFCALHTSGSTGKPKMSLLKHSGMMNFIAANQRFWKDVDTVVSATIITFDAFVMDSVLSVAQGKQVVLANDAQIYNQTLFEQLFCHSNKNMLFSTPTKLENYIDRSIDKKFLSKVKSFVVGGEVFGDTLLEKIEEHTEDSNVFNIYGPTETTICVIVDELEKGKEITIGKPNANTQIYIVDQYMQPTPIGVTGELCIAGDGVGAGYLNRPELTAEKFIDNPFGEGKLYKTGDLAYWREDGNITYVGRNDFQVKIRGLRIELGEIENAICGIDGISQAVVVVRKNAEGRQLICTFYTGAEVDAKEIRSHIGKKLPKYMLPHIFTHLEEMPLTSSGKINRKDLPEVDLYSIDTEVEYVAPSTEQEKALVSAVKETLSTDKISVLDNFFDIGGDSLKSIELIAELEKRGYHTDMKTVLECETIKALAEKLTVLPTEQETFEYSGDIPATDAQMRVYTAQNMHSDSTTYNVPFVFKAKHVDVARLQNAVNKLVVRHESLRTHFENKDGSIIQTINDSVGCQVELLESDDITAFIRPFNLSKAPLLRVGVHENTIMVDMHHIITDGGSMPIFLNELNELYMDRSLATVPVQYKHFAIQKQDHTESEKYWLSVYSDEVPVLGINTDYHRGQKQSFNGATIYDAIDIDLHNRILAFCKTQSITPYVFYMSGFNILLSKFSGNEDIVVGMPISGRSAKHLNTIGMFVNTIALRNKPIGTKTVTEFLQEVKENSVNAINHQDYPYGELVKKLYVHTLERNPLFDVMFAYQSEQLTDVMFGDKKAELLPVPITTAKYDFTFNVMPRDNDVVVMAEYCTDLYKERTMQRLIDGYKLVLEQLLVSKQIQDISAISADENLKLFHDFNNTAVDYPRDKCVHELFEEQVVKTPDKMAVVACDKNLTYAALNEQANRIAHSLVETGVGVGDIVAFALSRKSYLIATILGILKAGAVYLPVDPDYPQDRINYILRDSKAKRFITDSEIENYLNNNQTHNPTIEIASEDLCYCIYTSGSTGNPKGALVCHRNMANFCKNTPVNNLQHYVAQNCNTVLACGSITFDISNFEILLSLLLNKSVVLASEKELTNTNLLADLILQNHIDCIHCTPTKLHTYLDNKVFAAAFKEIRCVMVGGEQLTEEVCNIIRDYCNATIFNGYGPTETTMGVGFGEVNEFGITIGKPIANTQIYIVDKHLKPTPIGVTGELCIAGDGVGAGYLNRPELTAEKFIDNPFGEGKLYKTGDLAYWREDGNIAYVGRNDFQVKIRGLRIELGEIENAICGIDGISQAVVVVRKNNEGRQLVCAFYTGAEVDAKEIRAHIGKKLPKYMLPHICAHLDEMPLTSSGKVNRKALPEVDLYATQTDVEYVAPATEQEKVLISAIEATLGINKVGIMDNFFDVGGDSLKAIELISKLEKQGYHTDTKTIFECDTVKELAEKLTATETEQEAFDYSGNIPATDAQMRVYTAQSMNSDSTTYNVPYVFKVDSVDIERLQNAVNGLIARHESLRTHFENKGGNIVQIINDKVECKVEILDSDDITAFIRPFNLEVAPLLRISVYKNTIMVDMHHIITDGGSMPVFLNELNELYMGRSIESAPVQYKQFAVQKHNHTESKKYWLSVYGDEVPVLEINTDYHRGQKQSFNGAAIYGLVGIDLHNQILAFCKAQNITPYVFYMSGFNILLSKFSGNEDVVVGMPISGRDAKFLDTVGMFVNTIALRNKPIGVKTVAEFLQEVKTNSIDAINHQDYPYGELVKKLDIHTSDRNPLFDVMFAYQSEQMTDVVFGDKKAELLPVPITTSKYDFTFNVMPRDNDVVIMAEYCTDLYKERTVQRLIDGYKLILQQLLCPGVEIKDIVAMSEAEQRTLFYNFNDTAKDYPKDKCIYQAFEEQVQLASDKTAVIFKDVALTYGELEILVKDYANKLFSLGAKANDIVAVHLDRSHKLIAFQLAVLKIGAAFLPVDKRYPIDRIEYMCSDCDVKLLISDELNADDVNANIIRINDFEAVVTTDIAQTVVNHDVCYIIYTSGSTGNPKGCMLQGRGLVNFCKNNNTLEFLDEQTDCVFACVNSVSFDYFIAESLLPLTNGFTTVVLDDNESTMQEQFLDVVAKNNINVVMTTPTRLKIYFDDKCNCDKLKQLRCISTSGEPLTPELLSQMYDKAPDAQVYNPIGPSECSVWDIGGKLERADGIDIHIGKPIANTQIYIVDQYMQLTPIGVTGELCIAGDGVGAGYLNRPKLTAEKFIDNPFGEGKLYKTGDLAYWRGDGNIAYVGRNDFQVKIRGLRIELGEIENAICGIDGISQAVVVVRKNAEGRQLICAFYTGAEVDAKEIRTHIGKKLPKYMVPHIFTHLDEMPLTSSGKINRKALPEVSLDNLTNESKHVAPKTQMQKKLCHLMEDILGISPIGITDDFFDYGGDSLKAITLVSVAHSEGIYFSLQNVFDYPTIKELCTCIEEGDKQVISFADVDFTAVNEVLAKNKIEHITEPQKRDVGNILLAGATGYLGTHILADYLDNDAGTAYCLVRGKDKADSENRLRELIGFYFGDKYANTNRIEVICADLQKDKFGLSDAKYEDLLSRVDMVINCAASVKHYGSYKYFYEANVETTKRLIEFCKAADAKLVHTSTLSVSGNSNADEFAGFVSEETLHFYESTLYIGQPLNNVYARSKFEAEKAVLDAMANGLQANIMRMGNLTNRISDGQFQKNHESNAALQHVRSMLELGLVPDYLMDIYAEFTPIDESANAVMTIARHFSTAQTVFHVNTIKVLYMDSLLKIFNELGFVLKVASGAVFTETLRQTAKQTGMEHIFETFINDMDENDQLNYDSNIRIENDFTVEYLKRLDFEWSDIDISYLRKYVEYFRKIGYFR